MERITPAEIDRVYDLVETCLDEYDTFRDATIVLRKAIWSEELDQLVQPPVDVASGFESAAETVRDACTVGRAALQGISSLLHEETGGRYPLGSAEEPTCAEAIVASLPHEINMRGVKPTDVGQQLIGLLGRFDLYHDYPAKAARADLKIERARMKSAARARSGSEVENRDGYWYFKDGDVVFDGPLVKLKGQQRRFMRLLIQRGNCGVTWSEFNDSEWGEDDISEKRVHSAVYMLRDKLAELGCPQIGEAIQPTGEGYQLLLN